jgi:hypothetical protein
MLRYYSRFSAWVELILAFALLGWQVALPWTVPHFVTQDGPSHLYGATVIRDLVFNHAHSVYSLWYTIQRIPLPNWTASLALALLEAVGGVERAERLFVSAAILAGFFAVAYAIRGLSRDANPFTPLTNFLLHTWFLWLGFYNFYLGMALMPFAIGYYARYAGKFTRRRAAALAAILLAIFLTHLIAAAVAAMAVLSMALWMALANPREARRRELAMIAAALFPVCALMAFYALQPHDRVKFAIKALWAWHEFPMHVFVTASGDDGTQRLLRNILSVYIVAAAASMRKEEWRSPRAGLFLAAVGAFLLYIFVPDEGVGGGMVKIRFSWAMFFLGGIAALSVSRMRWVRAPLAVCAAILLAPNFTATTRTLQGMSAMADDYLPVAEQIPPGARFVRFHYAMPDAPDRFGYGNAGRDPLAHLDGFAAARVRAVDMSDYEALSRNFPLVYKKKIDPGFQSGLAAFEGPDSGTLPTLLWLNHELPLPIEYVLLIGDEHAPAADRQGIHQMLEYLDSHDVLAAASKSGWMKLYRARAPRE